jgi:hypothetical protein
LEHAAQPLRSVPITDETTVRALAEQTNSSLGEVRSMLDAEKARLSAGASVKNFISVIATRRVKEQLCLKGRKAN